jgi:uncharacterized repeat protein (TIGR01451 family)
VMGQVEGVWTNGFAVRGEEADGEQGNNVVEWVIEVRRETDLAVGLELGQEEGLVGRELGYEVVVTNLGPHEARGVVLEMEWLGKVELVMVEASQGDWVQTASHLVWMSGDLPALMEARLRVRVSPLRAGHVTCEAVVSSATFDAVAENDSASVGIEVLPLADLVLAQSASHSPVMVGDRLTYTISVLNRGEYTVGDGRLIDELPAGVELVSTIVSQGVLSSVAGVVEWDLGPLESGSSASVMATVVPQQTGQLTNLVRLRSAYLGSEHPELISEEVVESVAVPPLGITADGSRVVLSWPAVAEDYVLQVSDDLGSSSQWLMDGNPRVVVGSQLTVTVKVTNGRRFYRLVKP